MNYSLGASCAIKFSFTQNNFSTSSSVGKYRQLKDECVEFGYHLLTNDSSHGSTVTVDKNKLFL